MIFPTKCARCSYEGSEVHHSNAANAWVCLRCHLRAAERADRLAA